LTSINVIQLLSDANYKFMSCKIATDLTADIRRYFYSPVVG